MNKLENIIKNRVVGMIGGGRTLDELESRIEEFKDLDIIWIAMDIIDIIEDCIFGKIEKNLKVLFSFGPNRAEDEISKVRRISNFLKNGGLLITNNPLKDYHRNLKIDKIYDIYKDNIMIIENVIKNEATFGKFMSFPRPNNSMFLILPILILSAPKKIILFGFDGGINDKKYHTKKYINSIYYKPDLIGDRKMGTPFIQEEVQGLNKRMPEVHKYLK